MSATQLVAGIQKVSRNVAAQGAVLIAEHDQPAMVLMSVEHCQQLQRAAESDLGALAGELDALLRRMQGEAAGQALEQAFAMPPEVPERSDATRSNLIKLMPRLVSLRVFDNSADGEPATELPPRPVQLLEMQHGRVTGHAPRIRCPAGPSPSWPQRCENCALTPIGG